MLFASSISVTTQLNFNRNSKKYMDEINLQGHLVLGGTFACKVKLKWHSEFRVNVVVCSVSVFTTVAIVIAPWVGKPVIFD